MDVIGVQGGGRLVEPELVPRLRLVILVEAIQGDHRAVLVPPFLRELPKHLLCILCFC